MRNSSPKGATEHQRHPHGVDFVLVKTKSKNSSSSIGNNKSAFAKIRQAALEDVRSRALRHALVCGRLHPPTPIVATGVATSLYRDYVHALTAAATTTTDNQNSSGHRSVEAVREDEEDVLQQEPLPKQPSCMVLSLSLIHI